MKRNKFIVGLTLAALILGFFQVGPAKAATVIDMVTTSSNQTAAATTTLTSTWTTIDSITAAVADATITMTYGAQFNIASVTLANVAINAFVTETACAAAVDFAVTRSGQTIVLTTCADFTGLAADAAVTLTVPGVVNGTAGTHTVSFAGAAGYTDDGTSNVPIINSYDVNITATVDPTISFNVYTNTVHTPVLDTTLSLGTLPIGNTAVAGSDNSTIKSIWMDFATNADNGLAVSVKSVNAKPVTPTAGLYNTLAATEIAPTTTGQSVVGGTEGFGVCFISKGQTAGATATPIADFNGAGNNGCDATLLASGDNQVGTLTTSPVDIIGASGPISGGYGELAVKAAASALTAAGAYATTLTFTATGSF